MGGPDPALELRDVTYRYPRSRLGVASVSLEVPTGSIFGLLGVNGAGKTTLMRLMAGLLAPATGSVRCLGHDLRTHRRALLARVGSLIEVPSVYAHLTGREHLRVFAAYTASPPSEIERVLDLVNLRALAQRKVSSYSLGMRQRLGLATALLHDPAILLLDEPTNGLDPFGIADMRTLLLRLVQEHEKTVVVSSHVLAEVERTATHVALLHLGSIRFQGTIAALTHAATQERVLRLNVSSPARAARLLGIPCPANGAATSLEVTVRHRAEVADTVRRLVLAGIDVFEAREVRSLEHDFFALLEEGSDAR